MAFRFVTQPTLLCISLIVAMSTASSHRAVPVGVYWGQNSNEGSLLDACATGNYQILFIAFLTSDDSGRIGLNLAGHCNPFNGGCTRLSEEIRYCQGLGIKVLLSIGVELNSSADATNAAEYIWNNFLSGKSSSRPLGDAILDGVHFVNLLNFSPSHWATLAKALEKYRQQWKKFYLSAASQCPFPDFALQPALDTSLFHYISVQFYNNPPCQYYNNSVQNLLARWNNWTEINARQVFIELPASPEAAISGYIPPDVFRTQVLPKIEERSKFVGVVLWSRNFDRGYSSAINLKVCGSAETRSRTIGDMAMFPMGNEYGGARGFRTCAGTCEIA